MPIFDYHVNTLYGHIKLRVPVEKNNMKTLRPLAHTM